MNRFFPLFFLFIISLSISINAQNTVRIVSWNVLNYPDPSGVTADTSFRNPYFREVVQYINPDIFVITELATTNGYLLFLNNVMNAAGTGQYSAGTFINGPDTDNGIYYRTSDFQFLSNNPIQTVLRDISEFTLVHNASGDTIRIYGCHLKASSGISNEIQRAAEVDSLRKVTNALPAGSDFIVCGDFNMYGEYEQAYYKLTVDNVTDDGNFIDPLNIPGIWNQPLYSEYHTQSTRFGSVGGGAPGGMNDRFDMILYSNGIDQPGRITYLINSFTNPGNDGLHYNQSINIMPNTSVPQNIANALYWSSDHLPVYADFEFAPTGIEEVAGNSGSWELDVFPNPSCQNISLHYSIKKESDVQLILYNSMGKVVKEFEVKNTTGYHQESFSIKDLSSGVYNVSLSAGDILLNRKLIIVLE